MTTIDELYTVLRASELQPGDVLTSGGFYQGRTVARALRVTRSIFLYFADGSRVSVDARYRYEIRRAGGKK